MKARVRKFKYMDMLGKENEISLYKNQKCLVRNVIRCWLESKNIYINSIQKYRDKPLKYKIKLLYNYKNKKYKKRVVSKIKSIAYLKQNNQTTKTQFLKSARHGKYIVHNYIKNYWKRDNQKLMFINSRRHLSKLKVEKKYFDIINTPIKEYPKLGYNLLIKNYPFIEKDGRKIQLDTSIKNINNYNLEIFKDGSQKIIAIINKEGTVNELICNVDDFKINSIDKKIDFKTSKDGITNIKSFDLNMGVFNKITNNKNRNLFNKDIDI